MIASPCPRCRSAAVWEPRTGAYASPTSGLERASMVHRPLDGTPKTATIRRSSTGKWYVSLVCACAEPAPMPETGRHVGIDVGLKTFAMLSTGDEVAHPRFFRQEEQALAKAQRRLSQEEKGTP